MSYRVYSFDSQAPGRFVTDGLYTAKEILENIQEERLFWGDDVIITIDYDAHTVAYFAPGDRREPYWFATEEPDDEEEITGWLSPDNWIQGTGQSRDYTTFDLNWHEWISRFWNECS